MTRQVRKGTDKATLRLRPREWPWCAGPPDAPPATSCRQRDGRPLHALACTRRLRRVAKLFTQSKCYGTSARQCQRPTREGSDARTAMPSAAAIPEIQGHALPRAPNLFLSRGTLHQSAPEPSRVPMEERRSADTRSCERAASGTLPINRSDQARRPRNGAKQECEHSWRETGQRHS